MLRSLLLKTQHGKSCFCITQKWARLQSVTNSTATTKSPEPIDTIFELEQAHIDEVVRVEPSLAIISLQSWQRTHETFLNQGLKTTNFLRIAAGNPSVFSHSPQRIAESLEHWRACQFGENLLHLLVTKYPELLNVTDGRRLRHHIAYLKTFAGSSKNIWKMLMNCPNVMEQKELEIEKKIEYMTKNMRLEPPEIIKSEALAKSLFHIRCRHMFQVRLGIFKPRSHKAIEHEPSKNHRLYQITDTSDKAFATKLCHVTLAEYEAFQELYQRELEREEEEAEEEENALSDEE